MGKSDLCKEYTFVRDQYCQLSPSDQGRNTGSNIRITLNQILGIYNKNVSTVQADSLLRHSQGLLNAASDVCCSREKSDLWDEYSSVREQYLQLSPSDQGSSTGNNIRSILNQIFDIYSGKVSDAPLGRAQRAGNLIAHAIALKAASGDMDRTLISQHSKYIFDKYADLSLKGTEQGEVIQKTIQAAKDAAKPTWKIPWKGIAIAGTVVALGAVAWYANSLRESYLEGLRGPTLKDCIQSGCQSPVEPKQSGAPSLMKREITFGTTYVPGGKHRGYSALVDENHKEYAERWGITHEVVKENLLKGQCTTFYRKYDCSPYWNKIKVLKDWIEEPKKPDTEEWRIFADDDMVVTNMKIDPSEAIDALRDGVDSSAIVAEDVAHYKGDHYPRYESINTGLLFVRKDEAAKSLINEIWKRRNYAVADPRSYCPTLGICEQQHSLHEQEALANIIHEYPTIKDRLLTIVPVRDEASESRGHIALNTFERSGEFLKDAKDWTTGCFSYWFDSDNPEGKWHTGDWMGQAAGVPTYGRYCWHGSPRGQPRLIREEKLVAMMDKVVR